jgi:hypothetical protein
VRIPMNFVCPTLVTGKNADGKNTKRRLCEPALSFSALRESPHKVHTNQFMTEREAYNTQQKIMKERYFKSAVFMQRQLFNNRYIQGVEGREGRDPTTLPFPSAVRSSSAEGRSILKKLKKGKTK